MARRKVKTKNQPVATTPTAEQVEEILDEIVDGATERQALAFIGDNYPNLDPRKTLTAAFESLINEGNPNTLAVRGFCFRALQKIYRENVDHPKTVPTALSAIKEMRRLAENIVTFDDDTENAVSQNDDENKKGK